MKKRIMELNRFFTGVSCLCAVLLVVSRATAQNLYAETGGITGGGSIVAFTPEGAETTVGYGNNGGGACLAFDSAGNLFAGDGQSIMEITPSGQESGFVSGLGYPSALAFNNSGILFAANIDGSNIVEITTSGSISTFYASDIGAPFGLAFNRTGYLFQSDWEHGNIYEYAPNGTRTIFASGVNEAYGLAFNAAGDLFVSIQSGDIYEYTPNGTQSLFASGLDQPRGLAFNSSGNLFAATDDGIIEFSPGGTQSTFVSGDYDTLAFQGEALPVPEPGGLVLFYFGLAMTFAGRRLVRGRN